MGTAPATTGLGILTVSFLAVSVSIETAYSWRNRLANPFYLSLILSARGTTR